MEAISPVISAVNPAPSAINAITEATPIITPNMVKTARILLAKILSNAVKKLSDKFMMFTYSARHGVSDISRARV